MCSDCSGRIKLWDKQKVRLSTVITINYKQWCKIVTTRISKLTGEKQIVPKINQRMYIQWDALDRVKAIKNCLWYSGLLFHQWPKMMWQNIHEN